MAAPGCLTSNSGETLRALKACTSVRTRIVGRAIDRRERARRSLDDRGYLQSAPLDDAEALERLRRAPERLKRLGFAAAWLWIFDESWLVAERCWRCSPPCSRDEPPAEAAAARARAVVLRVRALAAGQRDVAAPTTRCSATRSPAATLGCRTATTRAPSVSTTRANRRCSRCGARSPQAGRQRLHVRRAKEADELLHRPEHPLHLLPFDQHARRAASTSRRPCRPHRRARLRRRVARLLVHWGGRCSRHTEAAPRVSLTATLRRRGARSTALQELQGGSARGFGLDALRCRCASASATWPGASCCTSGGTRSAWCVPSG